MRFHSRSIRLIPVVLALIIGSLLLTVVSASAETCCACGHACASGVADWVACYQLCQSQGDFFVNFHDDVGCSSIKACEQGACCDRKPECKEMTRLGCAVDAAGKGFLPGKTCADCPAKKPQTQIMVVGQQLIQMEDGSLQSRTYYVIIEMARLTKDSGYKGYVIKAPRTVVPDEHGDVPPEQFGDVEAGRVTREELSDDQWKQVKHVLDGLGLNPGSALGGILEDVEPEAEASVEEAEMANVSAPAEIPDPEETAGENLSFSYWEIHRQDALLSSPLMTIAGPLSEISVSTNDATTSVVVEAFYTKSFRLPDSPEGVTWFSSYDSDSPSPVYVFPGLDGLSPEGVLGGSLSLSFDEQENACTSTHWDLNGEMHSAERSVDIAIGEDVRLALVCSSDEGYASIVPEEIRDCARYLAWHSGHRHITHRDERWSVRENAPREMCDVCGAPMCVVCMEYDLETYHTRPGVTSSQRSCLRTVERYLRTATREKSEVLAAVYWEAYWDGRHNRNRP
jgi:hypothetical protein